MVCVEDLRMPPFCEYNTQRNSWLDEAHGGVCSYMIMYRPCPEIFQRNSTIRTKRARKGKERKKWEWTEEAEARRA